MQFPKAPEQLTLCCSHESIVDENAVELLWWKSQFLSSPCSSFAFSVCLPAVLSCCCCPFSVQIIKALRTSAGCPVLSVLFQDEDILSELQSRCSFKGMATALLCSLCIYLLHGPSLSAELVPSTSN